MKTKVALATSVAVAFVFGLLASNSAKSVARLLVGETNPRCIDRDSVCIGAKAPQVFALIDDDRHGLTAFICDDEPDMNKQVVFLDGVVRGDRCAGSRYTVELRSATTRTLLKVADGHLVRITEGPLHIIDF